MIAYLFLRNCARSMRVSANSFSQLLSTKMREVDKIKHMVWSFWLTLAALLLLPVPLAFFAVFVLGLAKECWDSLYGSGFCWFDMMGNLIGILAGLLCSLVFSTLFLHLMKI